MVQKSGAFHWFCTGSSLRRIRGAPTDILRIRSLGIAPIDIRFDSSEGNLILVEIMPKKPETANTTVIHFTCTDSDGKKVTDANVLLQFSDVLSAQLAQRVSDGQDTLRYLHLTPGWYSWTAYKLGHRRVRGNIFLDEDSPPGLRHTIVMPLCRIVELEYVESLDDSGIFRTNRSKRMTLTENKTFVFNTTGMSSDNLLVKDSGEGQLLFTAGNSHFSRTAYAWITDTGETDLRSVENASGYKPSQAEARRSVACREGHVYVLGTHDGKHIKFRVRDIKQP